MLVLNGYGNTTGDSEQIKFDIPISTSNVTVIEQPVVSVSASEKTILKEIVKPETIKPKEEIKTVKLEEKKQVNLWIPFALMGGLALYLTQKG